MRGIKRPKKFEEIVRLLAETPHPDAKRSIFPTMRDLVCFAAILGYQFNERKPLDSDTYEIDGRIFMNSEQATDLLLLLALAETRDVNVLRDEKEDDMLRIFEEYCHGGLIIIERWLKESADDPYGSRAILTALRREGFLGNTELPPISEALSDIKFE